MIDRNGIASDDCHTPCDPFPCAVRPILDRKSPATHSQGILYTKWLRFYWDFCHKYRHDSFHSDSLPLFLKKLQDKHQSRQQKQAQQAVSLFYEMQTAPVRSPVNTEPASVVSVVTHDPIKSTSSQPLTDQSQHRATGSRFRRSFQSGLLSRPPHTRSVRRASGFVQTPYVYLSGYAANEPQKPDHDIRRAGKSGLLSERQNQMPMALGVKSLTVRTTGDRYWAAQ